ncbi:MAG: AraC family transcriptional regulator [Enterobacterales bacterium]|nr:AraC family transcriptional regulator [Enterobacterales bacterium]
MVTIYTENHTDRDFLIDLAVTELSARLLRQQTRDTIVSFCNNDPEKNSLIAVISYIEAHLDELINIQKLCRIVCMGRSKFFTEFKRHLGTTPVEFQQQQRLKQAALLISKGQAITAVCYQLGFPAPAILAVFLSVFLVCRLRFFSCVI